MSNLLELSSFAASIISVVLALMAIWLSLRFYTMTTQISEDTREASKVIILSVDRLEKLFDKLYSDTFSMMKDTVSDMRKHMWPESAIAEESVIDEGKKKAQERIDELGKKVDKELTKIFEKQKMTDGNLMEIKNEMKNLVEKAIKETRRVDVEARESGIRNEILLSLHRSPLFTSGADEIVVGLERQFGFSFGSIIKELRIMKEEGIVTWKGEKLGPNTVIKLKKQTNKPIASILKKKG